MSGDRLNKVLVDLKQDRCLHTRSTWSSCSLCAESCPEGAIRAAGEGKPPSVELTLCIQCGQCLSACPLEAFESSDFSERQLLSRIKSEGDIRLHCFLHQNECASLSVSLNTYQLSTCLAALTPGALFELSFQRVCELSTDSCQSCSLFSRVDSTLECNVIFASHLLSDWGRRTNLRETVPLFLAEPQNDTAPEGALGLPSKVAKEICETTPEVAHEETDAFAAIRGSVRSLFHGTRRKENHSKAMLPLKAKERRIPSWQLRLKEYWSNRPDTATDCCPWPVLVVDEERCKACGICMQLCPTGSLLHTFDGETYSIGSQPATCVNCGLCIASCANGALSREYRQVSYPFNESVGSLRKALPCTRCKLPIVEGQGEEFCSVCAAEPDPLVFMERVNKQMRALNTNSHTQKGKPDA